MNCFDILKRAADAVGEAADNIPKKQAAVTRFLEALRPEWVKVLDLSTFWDQSRDAKGLPAGDYEDVWLGEPGKRQYLAGKDMEETEAEMESVRQFIESLDKPVSAALRLIAFVRYGDRRKRSIWEKRRRTRFHERMAPVWERCCQQIEFATDYAFDADLSDRDEAKDGLHWMRIDGAVMEILEAMRQHHMSHGADPGDAARVGANSNGAEGDIRRRARRTKGVTSAERAVGILASHPDWTNRKIADAVPCCRETLSRSKMFKDTRKELKRMQRTGILTEAKTATDKRTGEKGQYRNGDKEAWELAHERERGQDDGA